MEIISFYDRKYSKIEFQEATNETIYRKTLQTNWSKKICTNKQIVWHLALKIHLLVFKRWEKHTQFSIFISLVHNVVLCKNLLKRYFFTQFVHWWCLHPCHVTINYFKAKIHFAKTSAEIERLHHHLTDFVKWTYM